MKTGSTYEDMPFPEVTGFSVDGMYFDVEGLDFKKLFDHSLILNFRHILRYMPPKTSKSDISVKFGTAFYTCPKGIVMVAYDCRGMVLNTKISYVRGSRRTQKPVTYFIAWKEIKVRRVPWIHFIGMNTSYTPPKFMSIYNKKLNEAKKVYDECVSGAYLPDSESDLLKLNDADPDTGVYVDDGGTIYFVRINVYGRYHYIKIVHVSSIEKYL